MRKNGWILLLILICVAFLVSCRKNNDPGTDSGELVRIEAAGEYPAASFSDEIVDRQERD